MLRTRPTQELNAEDAQRSFGITTKKALAHRSDARKHKMEALKFSRMSRPKHHYWNALYDKNFSSHCLMKTTIRYKGNKNKFVHNWVDLLKRKMRLYI